MKRAMEKWNQDWHRQLSCKHKCLWDYICSACDENGVWNGDFGLASHAIGEPITETDMISLGGHIAKLLNGTYIILFKFNSGTSKRREAAQQWEPLPIHQRFNKLFRRRDSTPWSDKEQRALLSLGQINDQDLSALESYYTATIPQGQDYRRRDLVTLLNNFNGEVDRARRFRNTRPF